jgi:hypothetical protein
LHFRFFLAASVAGSLPGFEAVAVAGPLAGATRARIRRVTTVVSILTVST